jgi:hypothetical protein
MQATVACWRNGSVGQVPKQFCRTANERNLLVHELLHEFGSIPVEPKSSGKNQIIGNRLLRAWIFRA